MQTTKGFTLVELLVAVGIIGVLASVSIVSVNSVRAKARDAKRISEVKEMQNALEAYFSNNNSYPLGKLGGKAVVVGVKDATDRLCNDANGYGFVTGAACVAPIFMTKVNKDPGTTDYTYTAKTAADADCATALACPKYTLTFTLEGGTGSFVAGAHTASQDGIQ